MKMMNTKLVLSALTLACSANGYSAELLMECVTSGSPQLSYTVLGDERGQKPILIEYESKLSKKVTPLVMNDSYGVILGRPKDELSLFILERSGISPRYVSFTRHAHIDGSDVQLVTFHAKDSTQLAGAIAVTMGMPILCENSNP